MKREYARVGALLLAIGSAHAHASPSVELSTESQSLSAEYAIDGVETVQIYAQSARAAGVFGVEFALTTASDDIAIRSVRFDPAFSQSVGDVSAAVANSGNADASSTDAAAAIGESPAQASPLRNFRAVRTQPVGAIDPTLGANGTPVPFATVDIEIKNGKPFTSGLIIHYRGSLVGVADDATTENDISRLAIEIVNTAPNSCVT